MEKGAKTVIIILAVAMILGFLVIYFNPDYRITFIAWRGGVRAEAPILESNTEYYNGLAVPEATETDDVK